MKQVQIIITLEGDADAVDEIVEAPVYLPSQTLIADQYEKHTGLKVVSWSTQSIVRRRKKASAPFPSVPRTASSTNPASTAQQELIRKLEKLHQAPTGPWAAAAPMSPARLEELDKMSAKDASESIDLLIAQPYKWDLKHGVCYKINGQTYMTSKSKAGRFYARWWDGHDWAYDRTHIESLLLAVHDAGITDISTIEVVHP